MDRKLHLLESFPAKGSDGATYKVMGYEHMRPDETIADGQERWAPTGVIEFRLESGELVDVRCDGTMLIVNSGIELQRA